MTALRTETTPPWLEQALRQHGAELSRFVHARLRGGDASDVLQVTLLHASERAEQLRDPGSARAWLFRIARNALVDAARARKARERLLQRAHAEAPLALAEACEEPIEPCRCVRQLATQLPHAQAEILARVELQEQPLQQAAAELGITVNNATVRLHRARKSLRERVVAHCGVQTVHSCESCHCGPDRCCGDEP